MLLSLPFQKNYPSKGLFINTGLSCSWTKPNSIQSWRGQISSQGVNNISTLAFQKLWKPFSQQKFVGFGTTGGSKYVICPENKERFAF